VSVSLTVNGQKPVLAAIAADVADARTTRSNVAKVMEATYTSLILRMRLSLAQTALGDHEEALFLILTREPDASIFPSIRDCAA